MSSLWGNAVWSLFHTFAEKVDERAYAVYYISCLDMFKKICKYLPCPVCTMHANAYLNSIRSDDVNTKSKLRKMFLHFHNIVNYRLGKPQFKEENLIMYQRKNLASVIHNFVQTYAKKYNSQLLAGRMPTRNMRRNIAASVLKWFRKFWRIFHH